MSLVNEEGHQAAWDNAVASALESLDAGKFHGDKGEYIGVQPIGNVWLDDLWVCRQWRQGLKERLDPIFSERGYTVHRVTWSPSDWFKSGYLKVWASRQENT